MYEPGRPIEEVAREMGFERAEEISKLASNENAFGPSPLAVEAMRSFATQMHRYPDGGAFYLKRALASALDVVEGQILPGTGSNELIELLAHVFLGPGSGIVMAECAFVVYRLVAAAARADVIAVPMRNHTHDLEAMLDAIGEKTRIVFVSNPNNPTGTMVDADAVDAFMASVPDHVIVCIDEAYIELLPPEIRPDTLRYVREGRNVVVLRTFSKVYGLAGLRIGYAVAPESCIKLLNRVRQPFNVTAMALAAAEAALADEEHVNRTREVTRVERSFLEEEFDKMGLAWVPSVTNFVLVEVGKGREIFEALQRRGVIVRPMDGYGLPEFVRVTVGTRDENRKCLAGLEQIMGQ
ncbi:MAG: histidinol-phosphate transaminase [Lentisphaerae bacterium]|nr:histidinol-phosphate transaminase [Lentisphaerota bacterium]